MKQTLKKISVILLSALLIFAVMQPVALAKTKADDVIGGFSNTGNEMDNGVNVVAGTIINWIWGISIVVAVIVVMIIGLKFIVGSTQEKAKYKESLVPLVVGIVLIVFATTLVKFLFNMG
jgi:type IV secretory pathway VirB2 component (pilin)